MYNVYIYTSIHSKKYIILKQPENDERKMDTRHLKTCTLFFFEMLFFCARKRSVKPREMVNHQVSTMWEMVVVGWMMVNFETRLDVFLCTCHRFIFDISC